MRQLLILLVSAFSLTGGFAYSQSQQPTAANALGTFWQASLTAEKNKEYDIALQQVQNFRQNGGDPFLASLRTGWIDYLKQDYKAACDNYNEAARLHPSALNPLLGLLSVAQAQDDATEIRRTVDAVLHVDPLNYRAQMAAAALQFKTQNYREALSYYRRVLQYYPDDLDALSGEAWSCAYLGQQQQAAADFQALLNVNPDYPNAQQGLDLAQAKSAPNQTQTL